ncbi:MAG: energy-coupling factor ABC transporter permease [Deltaproteobacteria bacterium]|nr:energy-coupling factor ABC transporter permease [Deltaproteobacteria bacterium]
MHMADALLSPAVGGTMWVATAGAVGYSAKKVREELDDRKIPLMGVLGAFIFAAQMINFTIPGTGSSGHLSGALILSILLGPYAAFLTMASIITVQALFFADGGILALGCNIFNMGFWGCFVGYPLIYKKVAGDRPTPGRITAACVAAAVVSLQLGPFSVVMQTLLSGVSELPFRTFVLLMQPIHLAIGTVEGLVSAAVVNFVRTAEPEILQKAATHQPIGPLSLKKVLLGLGIVTLVTAGSLSWFASANPDGLEWSIGKVTGGSELESKERVHEALRTLQEKLAFLPGYGFKKPRPAPGAPPAQGEAPSWPTVDPGTSVSGIVGGVITLAAAALVGFALKKRRPSA